jgi:uncharacterized lipoprotein YbaY
MALIRATITGSVLLSEAAPETPGAVARIFVEEVSRADAPAATVARLEVPGAVLRAAGGTLPFSMAVEGIDPAKRYAVRVHIDADGDGRIGVGDHVSTESYPVVTQGAPTHVKVRVGRI